MIHIYEGIKIKDLPRSNLLSKMLVAPKSDIDHSVFTFCTCVSLVPASTYTEGTSLHSENQLTVETA